ncbi:MAG: hypothetical protein ACOC2N_07265 [Spirochaetota bacterium]
MAQFYLLSVLTLLVGGALAASDFLSERMSSFSLLADFAERRSVMLTVGILTAVVGVMKFFVRAPGDTVRVVGDFLPAIAGIATGGVILIGQAKRRSVVGEELSPPPAHSLVDYRNPIGLAGVLVGLLHFFFASAVIL